MSDITNYAYIWFKRDPTKLLDFTSKEQEIIYKIILDYSYPCYLANDSIQTMSEADKKELLEHELLFIQKKFVEASLVDVIIMQIPRVLYDLFNFYYYLNDYYYLKDDEGTEYPFINKEKKKLLNFNYKCNDEIIKYSYYINYTKMLFTKVLNNISELNSIIITNIVSYLPDITVAYNTIFETIIQKINLLVTINLKDHWKLGSEKIKVLKQVMDFEIKPSNGETLLYRGANIDRDAIIKNVGEQSTQSLSLNNSMLNGFVNDDSACTLNYITPGTFFYQGFKATSDNNKIKYIIKKFYLNDSSNEFSLFFIPPIHPFLQLYCDGELWHPRTKIGNDYSKIGGILCKTDTIAKCDYLISDKSIQELESLFKQYKSSGQISVWQKKYLKYKKKYLELKKYSSNTIDNNIYDR